MQNNGINEHVFHSWEIYETDAFLTKLHPFFVQCLNFREFLSRVWIFVKSSKGRIGDLGGPDPACRPYFGDPWILVHHVFCQRPSHLDHHQIFLYLEKKYPFWHKHRRDCQMEAKNNELKGQLITIIMCVYSFNLKISNTGRQTAIRLQSATNRNMHNNQTKWNIVSKQDKGVEM